MPSALPSPHSFLTSLCSSPLFPSVSPSAVPDHVSPSNALSSKPLLLTLHCLFPSEFLLALDLLDRRLIRQHVSILPPSLLAGEAAVEPSPVQHDQGLRGRAVVYYVRSSQRGRQHAASRHGVVGTSYEVRTRAWNCTCPAFALAAFAGQGPRGLDQDNDERSECLESGHEWNYDDDSTGCNERLGGLALTSGVPICKHLLACVLVERGRGLDEYVETTAIGKAEMAGWAAGWDG